MGRANEAAAQCQARSDSWRHLSPCCCSPLPPWRRCSQRCAARRNAALDHCTNSMTPPPSPSTPHPRLTAGQARLPDRGQATATASEDVDSGAGVVRSGVCAGQECGDGAHTRAPAVLVLLPEGLDSRVKLLLAESCPTRASVFCLQFRELPALQMSREGRGTSRHFSLFFLFFTTAQSRCTMRAQVADACSMPDGTYAYVRPCHTCTCTDGPSQRLRVAWPFFPLHAATGAQR